MQVLPKRAMLVGALLAVGATGVAQAATDDTSVAVTGAAATLSAPTFGNFPDVTLTGAKQTKVTTVADWTVNDARGVGDGWEVTMAAAPLETADATPVTMTGATLTLTAPTVAATEAGNSSSAPAVVGGDVLASTVKVADAAAGAGLGSWSFTQGADNLTLEVPAAAKAGLYSSTITTTLTPGV